LDLLYVGAPIEYSDEFEVYFYLDEVNDPIEGTSEEPPYTDVYTIEPFYCVTKDGDSCTPETYFLTQSQTELIAAEPSGLTLDTSVNPMTVQILDNSFVQTIRFYVYGAKRQEEGVFEKAYGIIAPGLISLKVVCGKEEVYI
jgi:hypothetical protein